MKCFWCENPAPRPSTLEGKTFCGKGCLDDFQINSYPKWMTGRIGKEPDQSWHKTGDMLCIAAPNKYRSAFRKKGSIEDIQAKIIEMQKIDYPDLKEPLGLQIDYPSWDQVLVWARGEIGETRET